MGIKMPKDKKEIDLLLDEICSLEREAALQKYQEVEAYLKSIDEDENPGEYVRVLLGMAKFWIFAKDIDKIFSLMAKAEALAQKYDLHDVMLNIKSATAVAYSMKGDNLKAIYIWEEILEELEEGDPMWYNVANNLVIAYSSTKQFTWAVDLSYKVLEFLDQKDEDNKELRISILLNLANAYRPLKKYEKSLEVYAEALNLAKEQKKDYYLSYIYINICSTLSELHRYEEALGYAYKALEYHEKYFSVEHIAETYTIIGNTLLQCKRYEEAEEYLQRALERFSKTNEAQIANTHLNMGSLYLETENFAKAFEHAKKGYDLSQSLEVAQLKVNATRMMGDYYARIGNYKEATKYYQTLDDMVEEQFKELSEKMISKQEAEYLRRKIEEQGESYRLKNIALEASNILINRQSKELQKSNNELHSSLEMLNRLISVISHDVRGPVASSAAALRMILNSEIDENTKQELLKHMLDTLDSTADLLTEIMIWIESRSYTSNIIRLMREVDINPLIKEVVKLYKTQIIQKQISLKLDLRDEGCLAFTEPNTLKIVLRNILSNAVKFTPEKGEIRVFCGYDQDKVQIRIKDSGNGLSQEEIKQLLNHQIRSQSGTFQEIGMGLGLRLSLGYLKLLEADLQIESAPQQGAEFIISIQRKQ